MQVYGTIPPGRHTELSQRFMPLADECYAKGNMPEASEMAWGAAAHYLKSIAKRRGWRNRSHGDLFRVVRRLSSESDDPDRIRDLFRNMNSLHVNFYEDWLDDETVWGGIEDAKEFVARLEREFAA